MPALGLALQGYGKGVTPPEDPSNRISPVRLNLELLSPPLKDDPKVSAERSPEHPSFRVSLGVVRRSRSSPIGLIRLRGELFYRKISGFYLMPKRSSLHYSIILTLDIKSLTRNPGRSLPGAPSPNVHHELR